MDATGEDGERYEIKGRRLAGRNPSRQLSAMRDLDDDGFDVLVVDIVRRRSTYIDDTNSHRFMLQDNVWDAPQIIDATARLRAIL